MKILKLIIRWSFALCLSAALLQAQETNEVEILKRQLKEATDKLDKALQEQRRVIDSLNQRLDAIQKQQAAAAEKEKLTKELTAELQTNAPAPAAILKPSFSASQPLTIARAGSAYMNIS